MNQIDVEPQCKYFVKRKKRFCKMTIKSGFEYCGEHLPQISPDRDAEQSKTTRIVCPLDRKHTCFAFKLEKHLKICNSRPKALLYISKGINSADIDGDQSSQNLHASSTRQLASIPVDNLKVLIDKINIIYAEYIENKIERLAETHHLVEKELKKPEYGPKSKKHLIQASSILGILQAKQLLQNDTCYIEFGAGKGQLSFWISQAIQNAHFKNSPVVLVERASHRHKFDNKIDKNETAIHRIKADIADLLLHKVDAIKTSKSIVGVTKHLCGDATDFALRCMQNFVENDGVVSGIIMAFCCHHRCQWPAYVGKEFFNKVNLTRDDFDAICGMVSWAICGTGQGRDVTSDCTVDLNPRDKGLGLSRVEKEEVGRKCKNILNFGRMQFLQTLGYNCSLNYYVEASVSPENVCIVATNPKQQ